MSDDIDVLWEGQHINGREYRVVRETDSGVYKIMVYVPVDNCWRRVVHPTEETVTFVIQGMHEIFETLEEQYEKLLAEAREVPVPETQVLAQVKDWRIVRVVSTGALCLETLIGTDALCKPVWGRPRPEQELAFTTMNSLLSTAGMSL